jgi:hypothetical protein
MSMRLPGRRWDRLVVIGCFNVIPLMPALGSWSEVGKRLMMMSGSGASTVQRSADEPPPAYSTRSPQPPSQRNIAGPLNQARNLRVSVQAASIVLHSNEVPLTQMP